MRYIEQTIPKELIDYESYSKADYNSDQEVEDMSKAMVHVKTAVRIITEDHQWTKRTIESSVPQIYEWTRQGYRSAREWLETRGIEEPDKLPSGSNTEMLSRNVTAVWLMYNAEHINWRNALRNIENPQNPQREVLDFGRFTIPLIASELVRLKY